MDTEPRTLVVTGEGVAYGTPDRCLVNFSLNVQADTVASALDQLADLAARAVQMLHERGIAGNDIQTRNLSVDDVHDRESRRVTSRVARYSFTVRTGSVDEAGPVLAALSEVAADSLQVEHLQLAVSDLEPMHSSARRDAVADAAARASQLAKAAGLRLGRILGVSEGDPTRGRGFSGVAPASLSMPVEPGEVTSTVAVTVTYAIED